MKQATSKKFEFELEWLEFELEGSLVGTATCPLLEAHYRLGLLSRLAEPGVLDDHGSGLTALHGPDHMALVAWPK